MKTIKLPLWAKHINGGWTKDEEGNWIEKPYYQHEAICNASRYVPVGHGTCGCAIGRDIKHFKDGTYVKPVERGGILSPWEFINIWKQK